jgi:hypothetical protein
VYGPPVLFEPLGLMEILFEISPNDSLSCPYIATFDTTFLTGSGGALVFKTKKRKIN